MRAKHGLALGIVAGAAVLLGLGAATGVIGAADGPILVAFAAATLTPALALALSAR